MKRFLAVVTIMLLFVVSNANAGYWSIECRNNSCVATQGALKVYWMSSGALYSGTFTGIEGIPISIDDYRSVEKKIESTIEKTITRRKGWDTGVKADTPEVGGPVAGITGSKENLFSKKRSMSQSKTMGKKINIDYTLSFVEFLGDTKFSFENGINKYLAAAEYALQAYKNGTIQQLIEMFFISKNADTIADVDVSMKINDENRDIIMTKYLGLTKYPWLDDKMRYSLAAEYVYNLQNDEQAAVKITEQYRKDINALEILLKPNQTALKLYKKDKDLAFAKWLADTNKFVNAIDKMQLKDKYLVAIRVVQAFKEKSISQSDIDFFTKQRNDFENAIKNKDKSVKIVTVKGSPIPIVPIAVVIIVVSVVVIVVKKKKERQNF